MPGDRERFPGGGHGRLPGQADRPGRVRDLLERWSTGRAGLARATHFEAVGRLAEREPNPTGADPPVVDPEVGRELREALGDATYDALVGTFTAGLAHALASVRAWLDRAQTASALPEVHRLAGEAGNLGFVRLRARLAGLERACAVGETPALACLAQVEAAAAEILPPGGAGTTREAA